MRRYPSCLVALATLTLAAGASALPPTAAPQRGVPDTLVVGILPNGTPPFSIVHGDDLTGIGPDILRAALGNPDIRLQQRSFADVQSLLSAACAGQVDVVVDMAQTPQRARCLTFSNSYFDGDAVTYGRIGGPAYDGNVLDSKGVRFAVERGFLLDDVLRARYPNVKRVHVDGVRDGLEAVADGRADFYTTMRPTAEYFLAQAPVPGIAVVASYREPDGALRFGLGARARPLLARVNAGLASLPARTRIDTLAKWTRPNLATPAETSPFFLSREERDYLASLPTLRVAFDADLPPYAFLDESGRPSGIASSYLTWLDSILGVHFQRVPSAGFEATANALRDGTIDMVAVASQRNPAWRGVPLPRAYASFPCVIVARATAITVDNLHALAGKRIVVTKANGVVHLHHEQIPNAQWIVERSVRAALGRVNAGDADFYLGDLASADAVLHREFSGKLRIVGAADARLDIGFALSPSLAKLVPIIDRAIASLPEERKLEIQRQYIRASYEFTSSWPKAVGLRIVAVMGGMLAVIAVMAGLLYIFRKEIRLRRRAEAELASQLSFQLALIDAIPIPLVVRKPQGQYRMINRAAETLIGRPRSALLGKTLREVDFWGDENIRIMDDACRLALSTGKHMSYSLTLTPKDGEPRYFLSHIQPYGVAEGRFDGVVCTADDVTEIQLAERLAQQAQSRLINLTRHLPVMVFQARWEPDAKPELLWVSGDTQTLFGVTREAFMQRPQVVREHIHFKDAVALRRAVRASLQRMQPLICDVRVRHGNALRWSRVHAIPMREADGRTIWNGYWKDMADERRQLDMLEKARDDAQTALRTKNSFLALMSHEIRTPMSGVIGLVELLGHTQLNEEQAAMVGMVASSASTLMQILDDILDYSKIEAGKVELESQPIDIRELCDQALGLLAVSAHDKGLLMHLDVSDRVAAKVLGDSVRLRQILFNLLGNAIKFTKQGMVSLRVDVESEDAATQTIVWRVIDTGVGIAPDQQQRLFEPFVQADASTTRHFGGTGLGLSICRKLAHLMNGEVSLSSEPGRGTEARLCIPLAISEREYAHAPLTGRRAEVRLRDRDIAQSLAHLLRAAGADVTRTQPGDASALPGPAPDLLFLDDGEAPPADYGAGMVVHATSRVKPAGYRLTDDDVRLSTNPLTWHGTRSVLAALMRRSRAAAAPGSTGRSMGGPAVAMTREDALARGRLVLVAEDHATNRLLLQRQLSMLGYACDTAADGEEAWNAVRETRYALLITDCHMPRLNGYDLARRIREHEAREGQARLPIVAITANADGAEIERCLNAGMDTTLFKPVQLPSLRECLERYVAQDV